MATSLDLTELAIPFGLDFVIVLRHALGKDGAQMELFLQGTFRNEQGIFATDSASGRLSLTDFVLASNQTEILQTSIDRLYRALLDNSPKGIFLS